MKVKAIQNFTAFMDGEAREIKVGEVLELPELAEWWLRLDFAVPVVEEKREKAVVEIPEARGKGKRGKKPQMAQMSTDKRGEGKGEKR